MRALLLSAALAALAPAAMAAAETLPEAMSAAVENNPTLAADRERLRAAREALPQAWAEALPQIGLSAGAGIDRNFPSAGEGRSESWSGGVSGSQVLFDSGRILANTRAARASIKGAVADYNLSEQDLLLDVAGAYADVRQQQAVVSAREQTVSNLTHLFDYAEAQFNAGVVTRTDVAQSQARLAQARTQLVQAQGALAAAVQAYMRLVGRPPSQLAAPPEVTGLPADLDTALESAGRNSPVLIAAAANAEQARANVGIASAAGGLRVTLEADSGISGDFDRHANTLTDPDTTSSDSVGVRFSFPLFQGGAIRSRTRQQRALASAANLDLAGAQRAVQENVTNAWTDLASARASVESAREQVQAAELAYEGVQLEQQTGLRATFEVLEQEQDLLDARLALAQAERDLVVAERNMLAQVGALTPQ